MVFQYNIGFFQAIASAIIVGVIIFLYIPFKTLLGRMRSDDIIYKKIGLILIGFFWITLILGANAFLLIFPILNLLLQINEIDVEFISGEIQTGILMLRLTSLFVGFKAFRDTITILRSWNVPQTTGDMVLFWDSRLGEKEFRKKFKDIEGEDNLFMVNFTILLQNTLYLLVIGILWSFVGFNISSILISILNWAVFFISDDWSILADYSKYLKGHLATGHKRKILFFNILLGLLVTINVFLYYGILLAIPVLLIFNALIFSTRLREIYPSRYG